MSVKLMKMVWEICNKKISPTEKFLLVKIADSANDDGSSIFPGLNNLENHTGLNKRTIRTIINKLIEKGILIKIRDYDRKLNKNSVYKINVPILKSFILIKITN